MVVLPVLTPARGEAQCLSPTWSGPSGPAWFVSGRKTVSVGSETVLEGLKRGRPKTSRLTTETGNSHPGRASNGGFKRQGHQNEKQKSWRGPGRICSSPEGIHGFTAQALLPVHDPWVRTLEDGAQVLMERQIHKHNKPRAISAQVCGEGAKWRAYPDRVTAHLLADPHISNISENAILFLYYNKFKFAWKQAEKT